MDDDYHGGRWQKVLGWIYSSYSLPNVLMPFWAAWGVERFGMSLQTQCVFVLGMMFERFCDSL